MKVLGYVNRFSRGVYRVQKELQENGNGEAMFDFSLHTAFRVVENVSKKYFEEGFGTDTQETSRKHPENIQKTSKKHSEKHSEKQNDSTTNNRCNTIKSNYHKKGIDLSIKQYREKCKVPLISTNQKRKN